MTEKWLRFSHGDKFKTFKPDMVEYALNPSTQESETLSHLVYIGSSRTAKAKKRGPVSKLHTNKKINFLYFS